MSLLPSFSHPYVTKELHVLLVRFCLSVCVQISAYTLLYNQSTSDVKVVELVQLALLALAILDHKLEKGI